MLPSRRQKPRMAVRDVQREYPGHRAWVRGHACCVPGCKCGPIEAAHVRKGIPPEEAGGVGMKPHDKWVISLCQTHHAEQHRLGEPSFAGRYGLNLVGLAQEFYLRSPHRARMEEDAQP